MFTINKISTRNARTNERTSAQRTDGRTDGRTNKLKAAYLYDTCIHEAAFVHLYCLYA